jgi:hypothetical protein
MNYQLSPAVAVQQHPSCDIALIGICDCLERIERDLEFLHAKLQPVLREILDDQQEWQHMVRGR